MIIFLHSAAVVGGLFFLYYGGEWLVSGSSALALKYQIPRIVIGLTIVAFGTSAPELFVSTISAVQNKMSVSVGNIIGSNIINVLLILGIAAFLKRISASKSLLTLDIPVMLFSYLLLGVFLFVWGADGLNRLEGTIFLFCIVTYLFYLAKKSRKLGIESIEEIHIGELDEYAKEKKLQVVLLIGKIVVGIIALTAGAELLIRGAVYFAENIFHVSQRIIAITMVAFGTSLPELAASLIAAKKGEMDISLGNIVGSNIFNTFLVLGITAIIKPITMVSADFFADFLIMSLVAVILYLFLLLFKGLNKVTGIIFLMLYSSYVYFLFFST